MSTPPVERTNWFGGLGQSWTNFWLAPEAPVALSAMRILGGLLFLYWLLPFAGHVEPMFGLTGWMDRQAYIEASNLPEQPPRGLSLFYLANDNVTFLYVLYWGSIASVTLFTLGVATRLTGVLTWLVVLSAFPSMSPLSFDADFILKALAFYLMIGHLLLGLWSANLTTMEKVLGPRHTSLLPWLRQPDAPRQASHAANLALRLWQVHFVIIVVTSALHKLQMGDWWTGAAYWFPFNPPFDTPLPGSDPVGAAPRAPVQSENPLDSSWLSLMAYSTLAWQFGFPFFAWRRSWRIVLLGGALLACVGSFFIYREPLFGPAYLVGCLGYISADEWSRLVGLARGVSTGATTVPTSQPKSTAFRAQDRLTSVSGHVS